MKDTIINRRDVVTGEVLLRTKLIRISIQKNGKTEIDTDYKNGGRGIYIKQSSINKGLEKGIILRNIKRFKGDFESIKKELMEVKDGKEK